MSAASSTFVVSRGMPVTSAVILFQKELLVGPPFKVSLSILAPLARAIFMLLKRSKATPSISARSQSAFVVPMLAPKKIPFELGFQLGDSVLPI